MASSTIIVMGVSGSGKTTVAEGLARRLDVPLAEADDFHPPANVAKMSAGTPLTDEDRAPWLDALGAWLAERDLAGGGGVMTCSALKRRYRDRLRAASPDVFFVHLTGDFDLIERRMRERKGHFMKAGLLRSQFADLEPLQPDEHGVAIDIGPAPDELVERAAEAVQRA
ncbi:gluconokinase [Streptomyces radicis]|uniref:Gluconokinase n=1 Tax=Streptomyces radicis TaxID=1750517 RepID=A0A3A9WB36_9ACTN|nr:gluconokinase [Streptomyces radicis]RKN10531.1 gluconokinase [Streptomyces radicis]RKN24790.1 gluconokinase [Streptomyces radicis]